MNRSNNTTSTTKTIISLFLAFILIAGTIVTTTVSVYGQGQGQQPVTRSEFLAAIEQLQQTDAVFLAAIEQLEQALANVVTQEQLEQALANVTTDEELEQALANVVTDAEFLAAIEQLQQTDAAFQAAIEQLQQTDAAFQAAIEQLQQALANVVTQEQLQQALANVVTQEQLQQALDIAACQECLEYYLGFVEDSSDFLERVELVNAIITSINLNFGPDSTINPILNETLPLFSTDNTVPLTGADSFTLCEAIDAILLSNDDDPASGQIDAQLLETLRTTAIEQISNVENNDRIIDAIFDCLSRNIYPTIDTTETLTVIKNTRCQADPQLCELNPIEPSNFTIVIEEDNNPSQISFPGSSTGTDVQLDLGSYSVTEGELDPTIPEICNTRGYEAGADVGSNLLICTNFSDECQGDITAGNPQTCTIENVLIDIEQDILDIVTAHRASNSVSILLGNSTTGTFGPAKPSSVAGFSPVSVAVGDFNGDNLLDIVTADRDSNSVSILLGARDGLFFPATPFPVAPGLRPVSVAVGDFNGDNVSDIVTANQFSNNVSILLGIGTTGTFGPATSFPVAGSIPSSVAVGEFD